MRIYDEYLSRVKSAAGTNSLSRFVERLCAKMGIRAINDASITAHLKENNPKVLDALREETQYIVLLMREIVEEKKEQRQEKDRVAGDLQAQMKSGLEEVAP